MGDCATGNFSQGISGGLGISGLYFLTRFFYISLVDGMWWTRARLEAKGKGGCANEMARE